MYTDTQISRICQGVFKGEASVLEARLAYLRAVVADTQSELGEAGIEPRLQLMALLKVHNRFYEIVLAAAAPFVPKTMKNRGEELHRRCNFARTTLRNIRNHVRAGGDIMSLKAETMRRGALKQLERPQPEADYATRIERNQNQLLTNLDEYAKLDKDSAVASVKALIQALDSRLKTLQAGNGRRSKVIHLTAKETAQAAATTH